jgi:uncharacterized protein YgbK (DUF1537 family)
MTTSKAELAAAEKESQAAQSAHRGALEAGNASAETRDQLSAALANVSALKIEVDEVSSMLASAEAEARKSYDLAYQRYEADLTTRQKAAAEKAEVAWLECALPGLPGMLVEILLARNLAAPASDVRRRNIKRPLRFDG